MRHVTLEVGGRRWKTAIDDAVHLSIRLDFDGEQPNAFGLPEATAEPIVYDGSVSDTEQGGPFNCQSLNLIPHGNGTHTECAGHLLSDDVVIGGLVDEKLIPASLLTVDPAKLGQTDESYGETGDRADDVITREALASAASHLGIPEGFLRSLVIRTTPNFDIKRSRKHSGTNPPYLTLEATEWLVENDVEHLLIDLPSVDREEDEGKLLNHSAFWGLASEEKRPNRGTITEMIFVPRSVPDGVYFVDIEVPDFALDSAPSRPLLFEAVPID